MAAGIRATGLTEEQTTALLDQVNERGFGHASTTANADDETRFDAHVGIDGQTDVAALSKWLDEQGIAHTVEQDGEVQA